MFSLPSLPFSLEYETSRSKIIDAIEKGSQLTSEVSAFTGTDLRREKLPLSDLLLLQEGEELKALVKNFLDQSFRNEGRVDVGVGASRLNRTAKRITLATEEWRECQTRVLSLASSLKTCFPGYSFLDYKLAAKGLRVMMEWDARFKSQETALIDSSIASTFLESVANEGSLKFPLFVCPPVNFQLLTVDPSCYIGTSLEGSLLEKQMVRLMTLFAALKSVGVPIKVHALIGDLDEDDYVWPVLGKPRGLKAEDLESRRETLLRNTRRYLLNWRGSSLDEESLSISRFSALTISPRGELAERQIREEPLRSFTVADIRAELARMRDLWAPHNYYDGLPCPNEQQLVEIVGRKFATYAKQGIILSELLPNGILIQTERPPVLRTKMVNAGLNLFGMKPIPVLYNSNPEM
jgi:hypothetical protein